MVEPLSSRYTPAIRAHADRRCKTGADKGISVQPPGDAHLHNVDTLSRSRAVAKTPGAQRGIMKHDAAIGTGLQTRAARLVGQLAL